MNIERLMQILLSPVITEKSSFNSEKNKQIVFRILSNSNKLEVKKSVELLFKVKVKSVQILNCKGKVKRFGRFIGHRRNDKKAYVSLKNDQEIDLTKVM